MKRLRWKKGNARERGDEKERKKTPATHEGWV